MSRIFSSLAVASILMILATLVYGLFGEDYNQLANELRQQQLTGNQHPGGAGEDLTFRLQSAKEHTRIHMLLGILTAIVTSLVQCVGVTYFIGTGRWFKEVVDAYALDASLVAEGNRIKRVSFPYAILGIATILMIAALGAAADPGTLRETTAQWVAPHYWGAVIGLCVIAYALGMQANAIVRNQELIERVMGQVRDARADRKLDA